MDIVSQEWRRLAKCAALDPDAPFVNEDTPEERAFIREACNQCPVRTECLEWALQFDDPGVIGGLNRSQRRAEQRRRKQAATFSTDRCGTDAGYFRHRRLPEKACDACRIAHNAATAEKHVERKRAKRARLAAAERLPPSDTGACGTQAGYQRHHTRQQRPCDACRAASREASRMYKAQQRAG